MEATSDKKLELRKTLQRYFAKRWWATLLYLPVSSEILTCEIFDFTPCAHAHSDIVRIKHAEKPDDWCSTGV